MRLKYPVSSGEVLLLDESLLSLKIARHSSCSVCDSCSSLHPPLDVEVVLDRHPQDTDSTDQHEIDSLSYLNVCACGHGVQEHHASQIELGREEFVRRSRVAFRLDEFLQELGKLLDFTYTDDDMASLRLQMKLPQAVSLGLNAKATSDLLLSPTPSALSDPPVSKKRRLSSSSLSDAEDAEDDDDEDQPLAARLAQRNDSRLGAHGASLSRNVKQGSSQHKGSAKLPVTGVKGKNLDEAAKVKEEEKMDDSQLSRLATGVTVDADSEAPPHKTEKAAVIELRKGIIQITAIQNDRQPKSLVLLTGLKTLFQKQLPKMPREYIARLVYDSNSRCLAIIKRGYKVVGGICYRPFPHRGFAEIAFFATASVDQVKGYGGMLMDHFKSHIRLTYPQMDHFLTYADNYAVGYFEKQGFSKEISLDRSIWAGYIKDYEGGTIMQCTMLRKVDYLDKSNIIALQQEAILDKIRKKSRSHIVYPGLPQFQDGADPNIFVDPKDVPGLRETGWTPELGMNPIILHKSAERHFMDRLMKDLKDHPQAWAFLKPVDAKDVPDYYDVIKKPMDFGTMEHKLENNEYSGVDDFVADAQLIFDNCRIYNPEGTVYAKSATKLDRFVKDQLATRLKRDI